jgi:hypothetical protein
MGERAYREGAKVLLGTYITPQYYEEHYNSEVELTVPPGELRDIHLIMEYTQDQR